MTDRLEVHKTENGDYVCTCPDKIGYVVLGWGIIAALGYTAYRVARGVVKLIK